MTGGLGELLRWIGPLALAMVVALWVDTRARSIAGASADRSFLARRSFGGRRLPPFSLPPVPGLDPPLRRAVATTLLTLALWLAVLAALTQGEPPGAEEVAALGLFEILLGPTILLVAALAWSWLAHDGGLSLRWRRESAEGLGLRTADPAREVVIGLVFGIAAWAVVLAVAMVAALVLGALGGGEAIGTAPSPLVVGIAGLPIGWRLALSLAAGVGEEIFFRGLLQPRIGLWASTLLFAIGHVGYGQPFLLLGVTLLSLIYGLLAAWRGNVWAAVVAHALFDAVQLLFIIPLGLEGLAESGISAFVVGPGFC